MRWVISEFLAPFAHCTLQSLMRLKHGVVSSKFWWCIAHEAQWLFQYFNHWVIAVCNVWMGQETLKRLYKYTEHYNIDDTNNEYILHMEWSVYKSLYTVDKGLFMAELSCITSAIKISSTSWHWRLRNDCSQTKRCTTSGHKTAKSIGRDLTFWLGNKSTSSRQVVPNNRCKVGFQRR